MVIMFDLSLNEHPISRVYLADCMEFMATVSDKFFELALVDPDYGLNDKISEGGTWAAKLKKGEGNLGGLPTKEYFNELFRISKNQIIWGGNYFEGLPATRGFIIWDKKLTDNWTLAMAEFAWSSFDMPSKIFRCSLSEGVQREGSRIHICQKPIKLYKWLLKNYAKEGDKILDTHLGSGSSRIACYDGGFDFWGCELDEDYFRDGNKRFDNHIKQLDLFR